MILPRDTTVLPLSTFAYDLLLPEHTIRYDILYISRLYTHVVLVAFYEGGSSTSSQGPPINGASSVLKCFLHLRRTRSVQPYDTDYHPPFTRGRPSPTSIFTSAAHLSPQLSNSWRGRSALQLGRPTPSICPMVAYYQLLPHRPASRNLQVHVFKRVAGVAVSSGHLHASRQPVADRL